MNMMPNASLLNHVLVVFLKELREALRDRRTLLRVSLPGLLMGPLMLFALSMLVAQFEKQAEQREIVVAGMAQAPSLVNYLQRQNYSVKEAPADYEKQLRESRLASAVLVVPAGFEQALARGDEAELEVVTDSANTRASASGGGVARLVRGFNDERARLHLMLRGVSPELLSPVGLTERDLASPGARAARITGIIPMFVIMAVLYGALTAALDTTSGERERQSLEPLLANPVPHGALVLGKWLAVALMGAVVAALASFSFLPAQLLIKSDALAAQFRFGWMDATLFALLLMPVAAAMGALLMAVAIRTKTFKEAQASANLVIMVFSLMPLLAIMNPGADAAWHYWLPGLGQYQQMMQLLKGEVLRLDQWLPPVLTALLIISGAIVYVGRAMRAAASR
ncbi:ABC transporter permease subunit [Kinneretia asaccharophila]|jgi:sodium transport system permease protein|uniref:Sodium transport system permease protein n=1 Tax=Roseateles asaccharophilus TaxID=582607 RepID=A0A4R6NEZ0_9BURK|nr:ABC transporter permease subunit [Roseateles asaccharophilus]MDN3544810.1 ABC transporter permease subunit [Roseateles asaccharophilus]TDP12804.1 sodium transport system permease protein [Roseateles asaccharophilus]